MKSWSFSNGIDVREIEYDYDLHAFDVFYLGNYLGTIYPDSIKDMEKCKRDLRRGNDPITSHWEDGCGNACTVKGWGYWKEEI